MSRKAITEGSGSEDGDLKFRESSTGRRSLKAKVNRMKEMMDDVAAKAKKLASADNNVIITTTTKAMVHFVDNWLTFLSQLGLDQHAIVFCYDKESYNFVNKRWPGHAIRAHVDGFEKEERDMEKIKGTFLYNSPQMNRLMRARAALIPFLLDLGHGVLFSDTDIVFVQNPFTWFNDTRFSIFFSLDNRAGWAKGDEWDHLFPFAQGNTTRVPGVCCGLMFFRPTNQSKQLLTAWQQSLQVAGYDQKLEDQMLMNRILRDMGNGTLHQGSFDPLLYSMAGLPQKCFSPGWRVTELVESGELDSVTCMVSLHFNFIFWKRDKLLLMQRASLWRASIGTPPQDLVKVGVKLYSDGALEGLNTAELKQHVLKRAKDRIIIVSMHTEDSAASFQHWFRALVRLKKNDHSVVFVANEIQFQQINEHRRGMAIKLALPGAAHNSSAQAELLKRPDLLPFVLSELLNLDLTVCYSDLDILWMRWPFPLSAPFDILTRFSEEVRGSAMWLTERAVWDMREKHRRRASPDFLCLKPTPHSKMLLHDWLFVITWFVNPVPRNIQSKAFQRALEHARKADVKAFSPWHAPPASAPSWSKAELARLKRHVTLLDVRRVHTAEDIKSLYGNFTETVSKA